MPQKTAQTPEGHPRHLYHFGLAVVQHVHSVRKVKCLIFNTKVHSPTRPLFKQLNIENTVQWNRRAEAKKKAKGTP